MLIMDLLSILPFYSGFCLELNLSLITNFQNGTRFNLSGFSVGENCFNAQGGVRSSGSLTVSAAGNGRTGRLRIAIEGETSLGSVALSANIRGAANCSLGGEIDCRGAVSASGGGDSTGGSIWVEAEGSSRARASSDSGQVVPARRFDWANGSNINEV